MMSGSGTHEMPALESLRGSGDSRETLGGFKMGVAEAPECIPIASNGLSWDFAYPIGPPWVSVWMQSHSSSAISADPPPGVGERQTRMLVSIRSLCLMGFARASAIHRVAIQLNIYLVE
jgi:hypothetical protein